jgi:hypothetical protein
MTSEIDPSTIQSIRDRLSNEADKRNVSYEFLAVRYGLERFLNRLSRSNYEDEFVLKGASLFLPWEGDFHRATRDIDFAGKDFSKVEEIEEVVEEICEIEPEKEDGILFETDSIEGTKIREGQSYEGIRIKFDAKLGSHELRLQLDVGFGDAIEPPPERIEYPTLLDFSAPELTSYRRETVISEKFQFIVEMGIGNSRLKDYYDIWYLSENFTFEGKNLQRAIKKTFDRRETEIPTDLPVGLSTEFSSDERARMNWKGLVNNFRLDYELPLVKAMTRIRNFLMPVLSSIKDDEEFQKNWTDQNLWE